MKAMTPTAARRATSIAPRNFTYQLVYRGYNPPHEPPGFEDRVLDIEELAAVLQPDRTTLLFGAGASIPSGAPSGAALARKLASLLEPEPDGNDLAEIAQIVENRLDRKTLIDTVRGMFAGKTPTRGLLALPQFNWFALYTTNYDDLIEQSYLTAGKDLDVHRSNYDMARPRDRDQTTPLYKIHGCLTQDTADGSKVRMIITENDYEDVESYRHTLFNSLQGDMYTTDTVIIGHSLGDRHLKDLAKHVAKLREQGVQGRVVLMVHEYSEDRATIYRNYGIEVVHGDLEDLLIKMLARSTSNGNADVVHTTSTTQPLPPSLVLTTLDVAHSAGLEANPTKLFHGSPATYADIREGLIAKRAADLRLEYALRGTKGFFLVIEGARGVGKTTLARAFMYGRSQKRHEAWEHSSDDSLSVDSWLAVEARLRAAKRDGFLLVDDATRHMASVNKLVDRLSSIDRPFLRLVLTVEAAKWKATRKSSGLFSRGTVTHVEILERQDLEQLIELVDRKPAVRSLVEHSFLTLGKRERLNRLQDKCSADMYVCLKNIFANDNLDNILLEEFSSLGDEAGEVYRHVAAVQALGGYVHRHLIMRILNIDALSIKGLLEQLTNIVTERDVDYWRGVYGWSARHDLVAETIAKYKFADQAELVALVEDLIYHLNPSIRIELETAVALASSERGIPGLADIEEQIRLFRRLIEVIPFHRTPRRRLIRLFLKQSRLAESEQEIRNYQKDLREDAVVMRYSALLDREKAANAVLLDARDRKAYLLHAASTVSRSLSKYGHDLYGYRAYGLIGVDMARDHGDYECLTKAIEGLRGFEGVNADPEIARERRSLERSMEDIHVQMPDHVAFDLAIEDDLQNVVSSDS